MVSIRFASPRCQTWPASPRFVAIRGRHDSLVPRRATKRGRIVRKRSRSPRSLPTPDTHTLPDSHQPDLADLLGGPRQAAGGDLAELPGGPHRSAGGTLPSLLEQCYPAWARFASPRSRLAWARFSVQRIARPSRRRRSSAHRRTCPAPPTLPRRRAASATTSLRRPPVGARLCGPADVSLAARREPASWSRTHAAPAPPNVASRPRARRKPPRAGRKPSFRRTTSLLAPRHLQLDRLCCTFTHFDAGLIQSPRGSARRPLCLPTQAPRLPPNRPGPFNALVAAEQARQHHRYTHRRTVSATPSLHSDWPIAGSPRLYQRPVRRPQPASQTLHRPHYSVGLDADGPPGRPRLPSPRTVTR